MQFSGAHDRDRPILPGNRGHRLGVDVSLVSTENSGAAVY